jgi:hypothetical protein
MISIINNILIFIISMTPASVKPTMRSSISIYYGTCICYKKIFLPPNHQQFQPIVKAFGKVVVDRTGKRFTFYFNGSEICSNELTTNYPDNTQGGEGFVVAGGLYSAHMLFAERTFTVFAPMNTGDDRDVLGYEYVISSYKESHN